MTKFLKLENQYGRNILINPDDISTITEQLDGHAVIFLKGSSYQDAIVPKQSYEEIVAALSQ